MRGSIRERPPGSGRWEVRVYVGKDPMTKNPVQRSRTVHGGRRKAEDTLRALQVELDKNKVTTKGTVAHLLEVYIDHLETQGASPSTLRVYRSYIKNHIVPAIGSVSLRDLGPSDLDAFYRDYLRTGAARSTVRKQHAILSAALKLAWEWGWVSTNPALLAHPPKVTQPDPVPPTVAEVRALLDLAQERNPMLAVLLFTAATTGARRGELCALRESAVDLEHGTMTIAGSVVQLAKGRFLVKSTKSGKPRRVALDPATAAALRLHIEARRAAEVTVAANPFVFSADLAGSRPARPNSVTNFFIALRDTLGLGHVTLHHLRHFMATQALAAGTDIKTLSGRLGHANAAITLNVYSHFMPERDRQVADHMGALLTSPSAPSE